MLKRKKKILSITIDAIFLAIILLMTYTQIGFIPLGPISVTIIHIPVLIGAYLFGWKKGLLYGIFFGCVSLFKAIESPMSILDPFFQNPFISVLPRALFGFISGLVFDFVKKISKKQIFTQSLTIVAGFILTMIHSVLVLGILGIVYSDTLTELLTEYYASYWIFMGITLGSSSLLEALCGGIITPLVAFPLKQYALKEYISLIEKTEKEKVKVNHEETIKSRIISNSNSQCEILISIKKYK